MYLSGVDSDLLLVLGVVVAAFAIPGVFAALLDGRPPRAASVAIVVGGGLLLLALRTKPGGYTAAQIPEAFVRVLERLVN